MINKENYEAYFLDYIEGNLCPQDIDLLLLFLDKNPQLKDELTSYGNISVSPTPLNFDKSYLKQVDFIEDQISFKNFEEFAIAQVERELNAEKEFEFNNFINQNPNLNKEAFLISKTKLKANESILYSEKGKLKKVIPIPIPFYRIAGIAAILLIMIYFLLPSGIENENFVVTKTNHINNNFYKTEIANVEKLQIQNVTHNELHNTNHFEKHNNKIYNFNPENTKSEFIHQKSNFKTPKNEDFKLMNTKSTPILPSKPENRFVVTSINIKLVKPYYETTSSTIAYAKDDDFMSPKEFLTSLFKKKILKTDNTTHELSVDDFTNTLASATNNKVNIKKLSNNDRFLTIHTKNFSFEKKISD